MASTKFLNNFFLLKRVLTRCGWQDMSWTLRWAKCVFTQLGQDKKFKVLSEPTWRRWRALGLWSILFLPLAFCLPSFSPPLVVIIFPITSRSSPDAISAIIVKLFNRARCECKDNWISTEHPITELLSAERKIPQIYRNESGKQWSLARISEQNQSQSETKSSSGWQMANGNPSWWMMVQRRRRI